MNIKRAQVHLDALTIIAAFLLVLLVSFLLYAFSTNMFSSGTAATPLPQPPSQLPVIADPSLPPVPSGVPPLPSINPDELPPLPQ